eukprot:CAMPEP_0184660982 /NCGR_PEP_ID=MMETSP0308-20130426/36422_1 /TAXON_ID=38269 /ORGANISM="Gloeochaete witrockiana, Strain SAG 46.84" /LENGTH=313 /DNA_ID=CAMNT_0027101971 /DNA_START=51 /DNA_END=989 /DNA_ORIENTATION=-
MASKAAKASRLRRPLAMLIAMLCVFLFAWHLPRFLGGETSSRLLSVENPIGLYPDEPLQMEIRKSVTDPAFLLAVNRKKGFMADGFAILGFYAKSETRIFRHILKDRCASKDGYPPLVVDVGVNFGYFFHFTAAMGCRVIGVEPNPNLVPYVKTSMAVNNHFGGRMQFHSNAASDVPEEISFILEQDWGNAAVKKDFNSGTTVKTIKIDDLVDGPVLLMKVDTEGFEMSVIRSAQNLISSGKVENFVMEFKADDGRKAEKLGWLKSMTESGYEVISYEEDYFSGDLKDYSLSLIQTKPWQPSLDVWPQWEDVW